MVLMAGAAFAQEPMGEVRGRAIGSRDNQPLALVQIQLVDTSFRAVTGEDGSFRIAAIPAGHYILQAATVGYYQVRQEFDLAAGDAKSFELVLTSSTDKRTDSVDVIASVFEESGESSAAAFTLEGAERKNLASVLADDPLRAVQSLPGVTSNNDFDSAFSLRGAAFDRIGLYLDGILLHAPFHTTDGQSGDGSLTIFNGDMTGVITLYEGAWPVRYADRTAGVLDIETREGNREGIHGRMSASLSNASVLLEGPIGKKKRGSWLVAYRKSYLQYILNRIDFGDSAPLAFAFTDGEARLSYDLSAKHNLSLSYVDGASAVDRTPFRSSLGANSILTSGFRYSLANLGSHYAPNKRTLIVNHLAWTRERGDVNNPKDAVLSNQGYAEWTWRGDATVTLGDHSTLDLGGTFRRLGQNGLTTQFVYTPTQVPSIDLFRGTAQMAGGYVQQSFNLAKNKVHLAAGVREDAHSVSSVKVTSPYASASYSPFAKTHIQFDWGQYAQFPELSQFFSLYASTKLLPERATHYEASIEQLFDDRTRLRLEFYDRQDRDLLARPLFDPRILFNGTVFGALPNAPLVNSRRGYARGAQIFLQRRTANGFTGWISYAYGRNEVEDGVLKVKFPSDYDQRHTMNAYVSRRIKPTVNLSLRFTYGTGMPLPGFYRIDQGAYFLAANRNGLRAPAYQRTDLRMNKTYVHKKTTATLFVEAVNLTNHHNRDFDSPGPYDPVTGRAYPNFFSMFPILPSAGFSIEF